MCSAPSTPTTAGKPSKLTESTAGHKTCLFQVIEHMDNLEALFVHLDGLSAAGAHLFMGVPNDRRIEFSELHGSLLDMPPNHIGRWEPKSFWAVAQRHGWRLLKHEVEPEGPRSKLVQYVAYRYARKRQERGSLANHIERMRSHLLYKVLRAAAAGL